MQDEPLKDKDNITREQDVLAGGLEECHDMHCFSPEHTPTVLLQTMAYQARVWHKDQHIVMCRELAR